MARCGRAFARECHGCPCSGHSPAQLTCRPVQARVGSARAWAFDPLGRHAAARAAGKENLETDQILEGMAALNENFCILESRDSVRNFADMKLEELRQNITARRNKIFLLMEEVRRLRIQLRARGGGAEDLSRNEEEFPSSIPFLPPVNEKMYWQGYFNLYILSVSGLILFGAIIAPALELKMGLGGTSYYDFITSMRLPVQMAEVDPIVASFCGGAVGVLTSLLLIEKNNLDEQSKRRCIYCEGTGYLTCGNCLGSGTAPQEGSGGGAAAAAGRGQPCTCSFCSGTGKVMCTACLCTGKQLATEHDPRVDPFTLKY